MNPPGTPAAIILNAELLANVLEHLPDHVYVKDAAGRYIFDNKAHRQMLGVDEPEQVIGKTVFDFFPREMAQGFAAADERVLQTGVPHVSEGERVVDKLGNRRWMQTTKVAMRDSAGRIVGLICRGRDMTERREALDQLAQEREFLHALMDNIPDTIYFKDAATRFTLINQAQARMLGVERPEDALGKTDADFFAPEHANAAYQDELRLLESGAPIIGKEEKIPRPNGEYCWVTATKVPLRDRDGKVIGLVGMSRDITATKLVEAKVEAYAAQLQQRNAQLEADRHLAREMQLALLPQQYPAFLRPGSGSAALRFSHRYLPSAFLGGDFLDVLTLTPTTAGVFICDVMGKGVQAALVTAMVRALAEELAWQGHDPAKYLAALDADLQRTLKTLPMPVFVSAFYGTIDVVTGKLRYTSAGHPPPLLLRKNSNAVTRLWTEQENNGPVLGLFGEAQFPVCEESLTPGDALFLYTDGAYEALSVADEQFGQDRLLEAVRQRQADPGDALLDGVLHELRKFTDGVEFCDDVCLLSVEYR